jgi:hypothetical protein
MSNRPERPPVEAAGVADPTAGLRAAEERHAAAVLAAERAGDPEAAARHRPARWAAQVERHRPPGPPDPGGLAARLELYAAGWRSTGRRPPPSGHTGRCERMGFGKGGTCHRERPATAGGLAPDGRTRRLLHRAPTARRVGRRR